MVRVVCRIGNNMEHSATVNLIRKYLREELSEDELSVFSDIFTYEIEPDAWDEAIEAERSWLELQTVDDRMALLKGYSKLLQHVNSRQSAIVRGQVFFRKIRWHAAVAIMVVSVGIAIYHLTGFFRGKMNEVSIQVPVSKTWHLFLADESEVWVNNVSKINYNQDEFNKKSRKVYLDGQAYFQITKNQKIPFIVQLNDFHIKVTGTAFDVKSYKEEDEVIVTLKSGLVELIGISANSIELHAGEQFVYNKISKMGIIRNAEVSNFIAWRTGQLEYDHAPLRSVANALERWFDIEIVIEDESMNDFILTLNQKDNSLRDILNAISYITGLNYDHNGRKIKFYKVNSIHSK